MQGVLRFIVIVSLFLVVMLLPASAQDTSNRVLTAAIDQEPTSLNPYFTVQQAAFNFIDLYLLEPWLLDENITQVPMLVEELPINVEGGISEVDDKTVVRFTIKDSAVWSDGTPVTAGDFIFPFEASQDGISAFVGNRFANIETVEQGDSEKEVVVTFAAINPDWFAAGFPPLPAHILREQYEAALEAGNGLDTLEWNLMPTVANGPFMFAESEPGSFMRFVRNEGFEDQAWFDEVVVRFFPDPTVMRTALEAGEIDVVHNFQPADAIDLIDNDDIVIDSKFDSGREAWWFNLGRQPGSPVLDLNVRRAIAMGLDRQLIVEELQGGLTEVPNSFWDQTPFYNEALEVLEFDPEAAAQLLEDSGWIDEDGDGVREAVSVDVEGIEAGTRLSISVGTTTAPVRMDTQAVAQDMLAEIGIEVTLNNYEGGRWATPFTEGGGFRGGFDDVLQFFGFTAFESIQPVAWFACDQIPSEDNPNGLNTVHFCWEELDMLWEKLGTETDQDARQALADDIQQFMADRVFWIGLWNRPQLTIYRAELENVRPGAQHPYVQITEWSRAAA